MEAPVSRSSFRFVIAASVMLLASAGSLQAQTARSGGSSNANAQLMQQMQQLASERTALQAEQARMKRELEDLRKERDALKAAQATAGQRARASEATVARSAQERETAEAELARSKERMQELIAKFRETAQTLREVETDRAIAKQSVERHIRDLDACVASNMSLYNLNGELLTQLENGGFWSRVAQAEPFTRLKRTELENLIEDYKYRAEEQKLSPEARAQTPAPASAR